MGNNQELHIYSGNGFIWKTINIERSDPLHNSGVPTGIQSVAYMDNYTSVLETKNLIQINIQTMGVNVNKQPVHLGYTYSVMELKCLRDKVYHDNCYRTLPAQTCKKVIDLKIYKRRRQ